MRVLPLKEGQYAFSPTLSVPFHEETEAWFSSADYQCILPRATMISRQMTIRHQTRPSRPPSLNSSLMCSSLTSHGPKLGRHEDVVWQQIIGRSWIMTLIPGSVWANLRTIRSILFLQQLKWTTAHLSPWPLFCWRLQTLMVELRGTSVFLFWSTKLLLFLKLVVFFSYI